jgi:hypothetical protein
MNNRVACPRCGQDWLVRVQLVPLHKEAVMCPECEAVWLREDDVGPPTAEGFGVTWFDLVTLLKEAGHAQAADPVEVLGPMLRETGADR